MKSGDVFSVDPFDFVSIEENKWEARRDEEVLGSELHSSTFNGHQSTAMSWPSMLLQALFGAMINGKWNVLLLSLLSFRISKRRATA